MQISQINNTNFSGVKLANPAYAHAKYVKEVLQTNGIYVTGHKSFPATDSFVSKQNIANYVRDVSNFCDRECGIIFLPRSGESWVISNKSFEQKIKKILDNCFIDSEINLGI